MTIKLIFYIVFTRKARPFTTVDGYKYKNKPFPMLSDVKAVVDVPTIAKVIIVAYIDEAPDISDIPNAILCQEFISSEKEELVFEQVDFNHPQYIMFKFV